jgi:hypothetical protein
MKFTLALINPPYGVGGNLAIKFLNKISEHTDDIRAVLPTSIRKSASLNKIKAHLHCEVDEDLDPSTFPNGISAVKQHWKVKNTTRFQVGVGEIPMIRKHPDFEFLPYERRFDADVFVGEYGSGPSGRVKTENFTHYAQGHHFLKVRSPEVIKNLLEFAPRFREVAVGCNGRAHFCKSDFIRTYVECLNEKEQAQS